MVCTANFQGDEQPPIVKAQVSAATFAVAQSSTVTVWTSGARSAAESAFVRRADDVRAVSE
jgi:hypothetical protein